MGIRAKAIVVGPQWLNNDKILAIFEAPMDQLSLAFAVAIFNYNRFFGPVRQCAHDDQGAQPVFLESDIEVNPPCI